MPPDMHESKPAVLWIAANVSKNAQDDSETFLYDPETDDYLGFIRLDKSTDHQVFWVSDGEKPVASLDDPRVASLAPLTNAEIQAILAKASASSGHSQNARLAFAQEASAHIMYRQLQLAEAVVGTPAAVESEVPATEVQVTMYEEVIAARDKDIDALLTELGKRDETIKRRDAHVSTAESTIRRLQNKRDEFAAEIGILRLQIADRDHKIKRQAALIDRLDHRLAETIALRNRQDARVSELAKTVSEVRTAVAS